MIAHPHPEPLMQLTPQLAESEQNRLLMKIYALAKRIAPHLVMDGFIERQDVEDLVHDVTVNCLEKLRRGRTQINEERLRQFVRRMTRQRAIDLLRRSLIRTERDD